MNTVAFILASWRPDVPAGMERAVAGHAIALTAAGHRAIIITADRSTPTNYRGVRIIHLAALTVAFPCDDDTLRDAITAAVPAIRAELTSVFARERVASAVYVDALWGLGRVMPGYDRTRDVLAVHVIGHDTDLRAALDRHPSAVIAPSATVLTEAAARGYDSTPWGVVPNTLLTEPAPQLRDIRERLYHDGPVRVLARLGPEKGVEGLLQPRRRADRPVEIALADAPFQASEGSQQKLRERCDALAGRSPGAIVRGGLAWDETVGWLSEASVVIVPSLAETFGLVTLEALAASTPVIAYDVGNLPNLIADAGIIVAQDDGAEGLWRAARLLLCDAVRYRRTSRAAYYRSRDYWPALVANQLLKVVS